MPAEAIMAALGLSRSTYFQWRKLYREGGPEALEVAPLPGAAPKLSDEQMGRLRGWLVGRDPRQFQFDFALWTRRIVRELIEKEFGIQMTPQGVGAMLHRMGLSPQRPLYRAYEQNAEAVQVWKTVTYPQIRDQARQDKGQIFFADESGIRTDHHAGTTWAPVGRTPVVHVTAQRASVNMISAVSAAGALHFQVFTGSFTATVFTDFLTKLMHDIPGNVHLVLDNVSVHKAKAVQRHVATFDGRLTLHFLPPYSPELNPDEWVWKNTKHDKLKRAGIQRATDLYNLATRALEDLQKLPHIIRGFFRDPALAYINT